MRETNQLKGGKKNYVEISASLGDQLTQSMLDATLNHQTSCANRKHQDTTHNN